MRPHVRYLRTVAGAELAHQIVGDESAGRSVLFLPFWHTHLDVQWQDPTLAVTLARMAQLGRLVLYDKSGLGLSGPPPGGGVPSLDEYADEAHELLQATRSTPAAVVAGGVCSLLAVTLATRHPDDVAALVLLGGTARLSVTDGYEHGLDLALVEPALEFYRSTWGTGEVLPIVHPSEAGAAFREWYAQFERASCPPSVAADHFAAALEWDVRDRLVDVGVPTLVLHREGDHTIPVAQGRYLADHVPDARFVALPGEAQLCFGESTRDWYDHVRRHLGPTSRRGTGSVIAPRRTLQVFVFSDIAGSTQRLIELGDEQWQLVLQRFRTALQRLVATYDGVLESTEGDGHLVHFASASSALRYADALVAQGADLEVELRAGVHVGEVEATDESFAGLNLHVAARVMAEAEPGAVVTTRTVTDLVGGAEFRFGPLGSRALRGIPGTWELYALRPLSE